MRGVPNHFSAAAEVPHALFFCEWNLAISSYFDIFMSISFILYCQLAGAKNKMFTINNHCEKQNNYKCFLIYSSLNTADRNNITLGFIYFTNHLQSICQHYLVLFIWSVHHVSLSSCSNTCKPCIPPVCVLIEQSCLKIFLK